MQWVLSSNICKVEGVKTKLRSYIFFGNCSVRSESEIVMCYTKMYVRMYFRLIILPSEKHKLREQTVCNVYRIYTTVYATVASLRSLLKSLIRVVRFCLVFLFCCTGQRKEPYSVLACQPAGPLLR